MEMIMGEVLEGLRAERAFVLLVVVRPLHVAHESSVRELRVTANRAEEANFLLVSGVDVILQHPLRRLSMPAQVANEQTLMPSQVPEKLRSVRERLAAFQAPMRDFLVVMVRVVDEVVEVSDGARAFDATNELARVELVPMAKKMKLKVLVRR